MHPFDYAGLFFRDYDYTVTVSLLSIEFFDKNVRKIMPKLKIDRIISFSSEDKIHTADNILSSELSKKWKCQKEGEKSANVILQLEKATSISAIDIGNEHSAYVELLVRRSGASEDFKVLLVMSSFMTPTESKQSTNINKVRMFTYNDLQSPERDEKWDCIKVVCTQPFNRHVQYGLSFITLHSSEGNDATKTAGNLGKFALRPESPDNLSVGSLFARRKETITTQTMSAATAIREASTSGSLLNKTLKCLPPQKDITPKNAASSSSHSPKARNRNELLYTQDEEDKHEKIDKIIDKRNQELDDRLNNLVKQNENKKEQKQNKNSKTTTNHKKQNEKTKNALITILPSTSSASKRKRDEKNSQYLTKKTKSKQQQKPFHKLLEGVTIVISGIQNPERADIRNQALALGAKYKPDWDNTCTHLVCAFINTPKFHQVKGKGKVVNRLWVSACHSRRKRLPWRRYAVDRNDLNKAESEEEILEETRQLPDIDTFFSSSSDNKDSDTELDTEDEIERISAVQKPSQCTIQGKSSVETDEENFSSKHNEISDIPELPSILTNKIIYVDELLIDQQKKLMCRYIIALNGIVSEQPSTADIIITTKENVHLLKEVYSTAHFVSSDWLWNSYNDRSALPTDSYKYPCYSIYFYASYVGNFEQAMDMIKNTAKRSSTISKPKVTTNIANNTLAKSSPKDALKRVKLLASPSRRVLKRKVLTLSGPLPKRTCLIRDKDKIKKKPVLDKTNKTLKEKISKAIESDSSTDDSSDDTFTEEDEDEENVVIPFPPKTSQSTKTVTSKTQLNGENSPILCSSPRVRKPNMKYQDYITSSSQIRSEKSVKDKIEVSKTKLKQKIVKTIPVPIPVVLLEKDPLDVIMKFPPVSKDDEVRSFLPVLSKPKVLYDSDDDSFKIIPSIKSNHTCGNKLEEQKKQNDSSNAPKNCSESEVFIPTEKGKPIQISETSRSINMEALEQKKQKAIIFTKVPKVCLEPIIITKKQQPIKIDLGLSGNVGEVSLKEEKGNNTAHDLSKSLTNSNAQSETTKIENKNSVSTASSDISDTPFTIEPGVVIPTLVPAADINALSPSNEKIRKENSNAKTSANSTVNKKGTNFQNIRKYTRKPVEKRKIVARKIVRKKEEVRYYLTESDGASNRTKPTKATDVDFNKLVRTLKSVKLPASNWKIRIVVSRQQTITEVTFTNKEVHERCVKFSRIFTGYVISFGNSIVKLLGAPSKISSYTDVTILLDIIHHLSLNDPLIEYVKG
ncbi:hypothetical protein FQA39_LY02117 [Lamprigera yunnana]|nr:hypothetical protein FQA39_LY02117 [Lamprigera yunnana]